MIDTHAHVHFPVYDPDRADVFARMREARVACITVGTSLANSRRAIELAQQHADMWATVGLHPSHVTHPHHDDNEGAVEERTVTRAQLIELARQPRVVAIGEAGLDTYRVEPEAREQALREQEPILREHIEAARELNLPLVIHCREALGELATIFQSYWNAGHKPRAVIHSFTGTWDEAVPLLDLGAYIGLNGISTFPPRKQQQPHETLEHVIQQIPLERLLLETDAPYLAPAPHRGTRNEPAHVVHVATFIAQKRGISLEEIDRITTENAKTLFGI